MTLFLTRGYLQPFLHHNLSYPTSSYFALGTSKASSCHQFLLQASLVSPYFHLLNPPLPLRFLNYLLHTYFLSRRRAREKVTDFPSFWKLIESRISFENPFHVTNRREDLQLIFSLFYFLPFNFVFLCT